MKSMKLKAVLVAFAMAVTPSIGMADTATAAKCYKAWSKLLTKLNKQASSAAFKACKNGGQEAALITEYNKVLPKAQKAYDKFLVKEGKLACETAGDSDFPTPVPGTLSAPDLHTVAMSLLPLDPQDVCDGVIAP